MRFLNDRAFAQLLAERGPMTRKQLARSTGLSTPAATKIVTRLQADGLLRTAGELDRGRPGPRAEVLELDPRLAVATGIQVSPSAITVQHQNLSPSGPCRAATLPLDPDRNLAEQVVVAAALPEGTAPRHRSVCISVPGVLDPETADVFRDSRLEQWGPGLSARIGTSLRCPVSFENDVNLQAAAERDQGCAGDLEDFLLVSYGQGVGAAVVMDGRVRRGAHGAAGEIGLLPTGGGRRHFQDVVAAWTGHEATVNGPVDWDAALDREPADWGPVASVIGDALVALVVLVDPQAIVLAGKIGERGGPRLREAVQQHLAGHLAWRAPEVLTSALGDDAALLGACRRARQDVLDLVFAGQQDGPAPGAALRPASGREG